jgi:threonyl-tRNA synthetase
MIHRAPFGSLERFIAVLLETYGGNFPVWVAPQQVAILPISEKFNGYAHQISQTLQTQGIRANVDDSSEKIGRKIREASIEKIPYQLVVGEKEATEGLVAVRRHGEGEGHGDKGTMTLADFIRLIKAEIEA